MDEKTKETQGILRELRFSQRWRFNFRFSGLWRHIVLWY